MRGLAVATLDRELPGDPSAKGAPEWVHLLPNGFMQGRDGRSYDLADPGGLILAFQANAIDLPVDYEHQADKPEARLKGPVPAAGWIKQLELREDGIWGRVEWTATAAELIRAKEYRYLSPSILYHPKTREIMRLQGAGLVHRPNLFLTALASQENPMPPSPAAPAQLDLPKFLALVAKLLGLPPDATPDELMSKVDAASGPVPDPAKYMPVAAVQELLAERMQERSNLAEGRSQEKVRAAIQAGYITPGMRDWALDLCRSNEAAFDGFLEKAGPTFAHLSKPTHAGNLPPDAPYVASPMEAAICEQLGLKPGALRD